MKHSRHLHPPRRTQNTPADQPQPRDNAMISNAGDMDIDSTQDYTSLDPLHNMADTLPCSQFPDYLLDAAASN